MSQKDNTLSMFLCVCRNKRCKLSFLHFDYENKSVKISFICIICCFLIYSKDYIDLKCQLVFSGNLVYVGNKYTVSSTSISHILPPSKIQTAILPLHSIWTIICSENHSCLMIWNLELKDQDKFYPLVPIHIYLYVLA